MELKFKGGRAYVPGDTEYDGLMFGDGPMPAVLIDDEDAPLVLSRSWAIWDCNGRYSVKNERYLGLGERYRDARGYAKKRILTKRTALHRFLLGEPPFRIKALNGNYLDCRRANLVPVKGSK